MCQGRQAGVHSPRGFGLKTLVLLFLAAASLGSATAALAAEPYLSRRSEEQVPKPVHQGVGSCDEVLRYDDGTDDQLNVGFSLFADPTLHQFLSVRFTAPAGADTKVEGAEFFSEFWNRAGDVQVHARQLDDPSNATEASVFVDAAGTWSVTFATPICVPAGRDYMIALCVEPGGGDGVTGEDDSSPDGRSYWSTSDCGPVNRIDSIDLLIWSCIGNCDVVPAGEQSWGRLKSVYR
jgi:hypothetical protein